MENNYGFEIIFEDNHIIVVKKEAGMPTQEDSSKDTDLFSSVKRYLKEKYEKPGNVYLGLLHRLDRPTAGVMVFAKTGKAAARLSEIIKNGEMDKKYFAVVTGVPRQSQGRLTHYLFKDEAKNIVSIVPASTDGAKRAELDYKVVQSKDGLSLVDIDLLTGRSHQARVQMASMFTPISGDVKYGGEKAAGPRLALFAYQLRFTHPVTKQIMVFRAYPPLDLEPWSVFGKVIESRLSV